MRSLIYIAGRFYEVRANRALRKHRELKAKAEKFFLRLGLK